ncbi:alpha/beta hydrolase [Acetobacterium woodii]|uniref:Alpha/beta hydrolase fold-5 domain-containing protein n=1 Tax=Acetobacterium woodii (strain ATCC 29683 / DSM 1030 / JCM 2381 / KCTC 1655 / WB1) TaxID=931626 RepID=H6LGX8_ACEWD|nr:alpha/beta hydrolase [Acetobacterium woodii]AFA47116.1 hypothetical protein Awo_c03120 [Acetobacterium woodii DSM 1030]
MSEKKNFKKAIKIAAIIFTALIIGILTYLGDYYRGDQTAHEAMQSNEQVKVQEEGNLIIFTPTTDAGETGFIFYPGGKVEAIAYAPLMQLLAKQGFTAVIVKMPFNLAVLNPDGANEAVAALPEINDWVIGGHSLGGVMAADYVANHPDQVEGLVLLGAYANKDLSQSKVTALSLFGTEDWGLKPEAFAAAKNKMPEKTTYFEMIGANHSGFGNYGAQAGDGTAFISAEEQQALTVEKIMEIWKGN